MKGSGNVVPVSGGVACQWRKLLGSAPGVALAGCVLLAAGGSSAERTAPTVSLKQPASPVVQTPETGVASFYGARYHGRPTASGEIFDMEKLTAAHRTLAFGTKVKVTRLDNGRSVVVKVNDRGPFIGGRVIDLSLAAARELEMIAPGVARVSVTVLK